MEVQSVVVTGCSSGIGQATAALLVRKGFNVFGTVRKDADAARLKQELGTSHFTPLLLDVTDAEAVQQAAALVRTRLAGRRLAGLINNAGMIFGGPLALQPMEEVRYIYEVNTFGPLIVTRAFLPLLGTDPALKGPPGRIIMVSSEAGSCAMPGIGAYVGAKHALNGMSYSLRHELRAFGIGVVVVEPGLVVTSINDKVVAHAASSAYEGTPYAPFVKVFAEVQKGATTKFPATALSAGSCAEALVYALTARRPRVCYWPVVLPERILISLLRYLPTFVSDALIDLNFHGKLNIQVGQGKKKTL